MNHTTISAEAAWDHVLKNKASRWSSDIERFRESLAMVTLRPKFKLPANQRFFCIGSCFARNIEEHLLYADVDVLSRKALLLPGEWHGMRPNGFVNKFTTLSMLAEIRWLESRPEVNAAMFEQVGDEDLWRDLQLCPGTTPVKLARAIERRKYLIEDYFSQIRHADIVLLTLGLNETWYDNLTASYLNEAPNIQTVRKHPGRYQLEVTTVETNLLALEEIRDRLKRLNDCARIIVTVSPVPMLATFSGDDVAVANMLSKSVLRVAAAAFSVQHDDVDYFPSYDMISLSPRAEAYEADCLHVTDAAVSTVVRAFLSAYLGIERPSIEFNEVKYLEANPDVYRAIGEGRFVCGYEHWKVIGRAEGRRLRRDQ